jgi:hypothetical protein
MKPSVSAERLKEPLHIIGAVAGPVFVTASNDHLKTHPARHGQVKSDGSNLSMLISRHPAQERPAASARRLPSPSSCLRECVT